MGGRRGTYRVLIEKPEGKYSFEDISVSRRIILNWIFTK
jgi:hypothetical protein